LALLEAFDHINLQAINAASALEPAEDNLSRVTVTAERTRRELEQRWPRRQQIAAQ
jgi:hypothetical protein